jgi:uncharacterized protein (DUF488 family)
VFTVGHSNRSLAEFIALLREHRIELLVDVRSFPSSRRHPQFNRPALERELPLAGVRYLWLGRELGGMRDEARADSPHTALEEGGFRNYADHMGTALFAEGVARLLRKTPVLHIRDKGEPTPHELHEMARVIDGALVYDAGGQHQATLF